MDFKPTGGLIREAVSKVRSVLPGHREDDCDPTLGHNYNLCVDPDDPTSTASSSTATKESKNTSGQQQRQSPPQSFVEAVREAAAAAVSEVGIEVAGARESGRRLAGKVLDKVPTGSDDGLFGGVVQSSRKAALNAGIDGVWEAALSSSSPSTTAPGGPSDTEEADRKTGEEKEEEGKEGGVFPPPPSSSTTTTTPTTTATSRNPIDADADTDKRTGGRGGVTPPISTKGLLESERGGDARGTGEDDDDKETWRWSEGPKNTVGTDDLGLEPEAAVEERGVAGDQDGEAAENSESRGGSVSSRSSETAPSLLSPSPNGQEDAEDASYQEDGREDAMIFEDDSRETIRSEFASMEAGMLQGLSDDGSEVDAEKGVEGSGGSLTGDGFGAAAFVNGTVREELFGLGEPSDEEDSENPKDGDGAGIGEENRGFQKVGGVGVAGWVQDGEGGGPVEGGVEEEEIYEEDYEDEEEQKDPEWVVKMQELYAKFQTRQVQSLHGLPCVVPIFGRLSS